MHDFSVVRKDLEEFGYTEVGCPRCDFMSTHGHARGCGIAHSKICRNRIKRALGETAEGRERLDRFEERRRNRQIKLENKEGVPAHLRCSNPCLRAGQAPSTPVAGDDGPRTSPRRPPNEVEPLPEESGEEEGEEEEATSMGEQASMEEESVYAPSSPAGDDDQDMGLLSTVSRYAQSSVTPCVRKNVKNLRMPLRRPAS